MAHNEQSRDKSTNHLQAKTDKYPSSDDLADLVRLVSDREAALQDQCRRLEEVEAEIEQYESKLHQDRCNELGMDYVYRAYSSQPSDVSSDTDSDHTTTRVKDASKSLPELENYSRNSLEYVPRRSSSETSSPLQTNITSVRQTSVDKSLTGKRNRKLINPFKSAARRTATTVNDDNSDSGNSSMKHEIYLLRQQIKAEKERGVELGDDITRVIYSIKKCEQYLHQKTNQLAELFSIVNSFDNLSPAGNNGSLLTQEDLRRAVDVINSRASKVALADVTVRREVHDEKQQLETENDSARQQFYSGNDLRTQSALSLSSTKQLSASEADRMPTAGEVRILSERSNDRLMKSVGLHCQEGRQCYESGRLWSDRLPPVDIAHGCGGDNDSDTGMRSLQDDNEAAYYSGLVTLV